MEYLKMIILNESFSYRLIQSKRRFIVVEIKFFDIIVGSFIRWNNSCVMKRKRSVSIECLNIVTELFNGKFDWIGFWMNKCLWRRSNII